MNNEFRIRVIEITVDDVGIATDHFGIDTATNSPQGLERAGALSWVRRSVERRAR